MPDTPERRARGVIDANLAASGWIVQPREELDLSAGRGVAICEFPMRTGFGSADYLLYLDRQAVGAVEAKPHGAFTGVELQTAKYAAGLPQNLPAHRRPLPFLFESNGALTFFTNGLVRRRKEFTRVAHAGSRKAGQSASQPGRPWSLTRLCIYASCRQHA